MPRIPVGSTAEVALPQPLAPSQAARIRRIFALQAKGDIPAASRDTADLNTTLLLGSILADRYLSGWMHPTVAQLDDWLAHFGDEADAPAIRSLRARLWPQPSTTVARPNRRTAAQPAAATALFLHNRDADAVAAATAVLSAPASPPGSGEALLSGGLAAWRLNDQADARTLFDAAWRAAPTAPSRAAAAWWAARTAERQGDGSGAILWLRRAAGEHDTFYGRIAGRALGPASSCSGTTTLGTADMEALESKPAGRRAFALLQVGEKHRAEAELRILWLDARGNAALIQPLALLARAAGLNALSAEFDATARPVREGAEPPVLHPAGGFVVDPSLVYGLVRHESDFHPAAVSRDGARGLMQIKPTTAWSISGARAIAGGSGRLEDPAVNLAIGQRYMRELANDDAVDGDLIRLLASYKQGPFELRRWADHVNADGDPLLFLEAMPNPATRAFVEDVLSWSWHYAAALNLRAPSLDALAAGRFPRMEQAAAVGEDCRH